LIREALPCSSFTSAPKKGLPEETSSLAMAIADLIPCFSASTLLAQSSSSNEVK